MDEIDNSSTKSKEKKYLIQEKKSQILLKPVEKEKSWLDVLIERDRTFIQKRIAQIGKLVFGLNLMGRLALIQFKMLPAFGILEKSRPRKTFLLIVRKWENERKLLLDPKTFFNTQEKFHNLGPGLIWVQNFTIFGKNLKKCFPNEFLLVKPPKDPPQPLARNFS